MSMIDSPEFGDEGEVIEQLDEHPSSTGRHLARIAITVLILANLMIGLLLVVSGNASSSFRSGSALIQGQVVNVEGVPIPDAHVYIEGMVSSAITGADGVFAISDAPAGEMILVIGVTPLPPQFLDVVIDAQETRNLGRIVYQPETVLNGP